MAKPKFLSLDGVRTLVQWAKDQLATKVDKVAGKDLSDNNYSDDDVAKLESIENGAQSNIIESISVNNVAQAIDDKNVNIAIPLVDDTLTNTGQSADAKATGDAIAELDQSLSQTATAIRQEFDDADNQLAEEMTQALEELSGTIPTKTSELTNDSNYATTTELTNGLSTKEDILQYGTATAEDVGKAMMPKTVADGKVTSWEFGEAGKVDDVQVNGTSILENKVANIPIASNNLGVVKVSSMYGLNTRSDGTIYAVAATSPVIKGSTHAYSSIVPFNQHESTFYGLAKAAGDVTQSQSSNAVGTYTDSAKTAIQSMLGVDEFNFSDRIAKGVDDNGDVVAGAIISGQISGDNKNIASGVNAHAEGGNTTASGPNSHAEGYSTIASGALAHAEGWESKAEGFYSHAEGVKTTASGDYSHAEGKSSSNFSKAVNNVTYTKAGAYGESSHSEGYDTLAIGSQSHAEGGSTIASESHSHAEGNYTTASGAMSHAEGGGTTASGNSSHAEGGGTKASGLQSHAEGQNTTASGPNSHTEGAGTISAADSSHAEGAGTIAYGQNSHAEGNSTKAPGNNSHAEGYGGIFTLNNFSYTSEAKGMADHTEGYQTRTAGNAQPGNHAEGYQTAAIGGASHSEGGYTLASGNRSHAEGNYTVASGAMSHAEGTNTVASGIISHAEGEYTIANHRSQHVFGGFNIEDPSSGSISSKGTYVEIVGNGTADNARSNARTLDWFGNEVLAGKLTVGAAPTDTMDVSTKGYVDTAIADAVGDITGFEFQVVTELPVTGTKGIIYLRAHFHEDNDVYDEYIWVTDRYERLGTLDVDLSNYVTFDDIATSSKAGVVKVGEPYGLAMLGEGTLRIAAADKAAIKTATHGYKPIVPQHQHASTFYGLAKAAGDTTQSASSNAVGTYTEEAKVAIRNMLDATGESASVTVTGTDPVIQASRNTRYICGEILSLDFTPCASGICEVIFTSGSSVTVLTLPETVKMPEWFEVETNHTYEISVVDGVYGAVMVW